MMIYRTLCAATLGLFLMGCGGDRPDLYEVEGTVTLDGQPLADAEVEFQPASGSPSFATTDSSGNYSLIYGPDEPGALAGQHKVRITTYRRASEPGSTEVIPERVPARYNSETTLTREVPDGDYNFELTSEE